MTRERQLLILTGAMLIALVIAIAAFSLGVYVGTHGWTAGPPSVAGPGPQAPAAPKQAAPPPADPDPQMPAAPDPGQPALRPQLTGQVRSVSGDTLTLDTLQGPRLFQLGANVQVFRRSEGQPGEEPASLDQVVVGAHLAVFGHFVGDGPRQLVADRLVLLPPPPNRQP